MRPPCAPPGTMPTMPPPIISACGNDRLAAQDEVHMDIAAVFQVDRFRVASRIGCQTHENAREFGYKMRPARMMQRAESHRPAIVAACGHDRAATQDEERMEITATLRSDCCRVVLQKSSKVPGNFSRNAWLRKKIADRDSFSGRKARQNVCSRRPNRPRMHRKGVETGRNGSQDCGSRCGGRGGCRVLDVPFSDRSK